ncbi:MAG: terminase small subunit [Turicibacter sp.]|nr:terminase small subunit [Turicibacter sp.]
MAKLTAKQQKFVHEYLVDLNATQAAIRAGYKEKNSAVIGAQNLKKLNIKTAIDAELQRMRDEKIATAYDVEEYLSRVLKGETLDTAVVVESVGDGKSRARLVEKRVAERERIKAAEILAKRHGLTDSKRATDTGVTIVFRGEEALE